MRIQSRFSIDFEIPQPVAMIGLLRLHPSLDSSQCRPEELRAVHVLNDEQTEVPLTDYLDSFGNRCTRLLAPAGQLRLTYSSVVEQPEPGNLPAESTAPEQHAVEDLPAEVLQYLLSSRYCQVDSMVLVAGDLFGHLPPGWDRAVAIQDWVHDHVRFDYRSARSTKTALDVFTERVGVCRDFQHLAITLSRAMNIPARYTTGYLGDIRRPYGGAGDFSAWYEVYLGGQWRTMDARHNDGRLGRLLMATGRDATDVAITTSFGIAGLLKFQVESIEVDQAGLPVPLPQRPANDPPASSNPKLSEHDSVTAPVHETSSGMVEPTPAPGPAPSSPEGAADPHA